MKSKLLFTASALALIVAFVSFVLFMEMYDVGPQTWGPQGVGPEQWHRAWSARRDLNLLIAAASCFSAMAFFVIGLVQRSHRS